MATTVQSSSAHTGVGTGEQRATLGHARGGVTAQPGVGMDGETRDKQTPCEYGSSKPFEVRLVIQGTRQG